MEKHKIQRPSVDWTLWGTLALLALGYLLIHDLLGGTLFAHCNWDSYTLQAMAWRDGHLGLGQNYDYLELAVYQGDWYVSFPPVPTLVMLPLTFLFGTQTPNNLVVALYALGSVAVVYQCLHHFAVRPLYCAFWSVFAVMGSNLLWMSTNGGVWFQAQALNFLLCAGTVLCVLRHRRVGAFLLLALAVGCRPFSACYFPALLWAFYAQDREAHPEESRLRSFLRQWPAWIGPALVAVAYMAFNYARFGNPLEFGHNYLPEFTESEYGQFHWSYILPNLYKLFLAPVTLSLTGQLQYPIFNGFMFYLANPLFLVFFYCLIRDLVKKQMTPLKALLALGMLLNLLLLAGHKTMGGWQFGNRYTVDLLPFALLYMLDGVSLLRPRRWQAALGMAAVMFNAYGALAMTVLHGS